MIEGQTFDGLWREEIVLHGFHPWNRLSDVVYHVGKILDDQPALLMRKSFLECFQVMTSSATDIDKQHSLLFCIEVVEENLLDWKIFVSWYSVHALTFHIGVESAHPLWFFLQEIPKTSVLNAYWNGPLAVSEGFL